MLSNKSIQMSDKVFHTLRDMIYERSGIYFPAGKKFILENRLLRYVEDSGFEDFDKYLYFLKYDPLKEKEFPILFNIITTNETSFFRDMNQLLAYKSVVLPQAIDHRRADGTKKVKIWSAACSTGEEPYSLAMLAMEKLPQSRNGYSEIEIHGSDISEGVLNSARRGEYNSYSVRNILPPYKDKYFSKNGNGKYAVKPEVKSMVRLCNINLFDDKSLRVFRGMDIIFCRNVLIYFDEASKKKVIASLYDCLEPGGYLFIGHSESLFNISRAFKFININNVLIYQK